MGLRRRLGRARISMRHMEMTIFMETFPGPMTMRFTRRLEAFA
jgi:hypothetical protein